MNIVWIGNFSQAHCSEVHWTATLEDIGQTVHRLQENQFTWNTALAKVLEIKPDIVCYTRTWGMKGDWQGFMKQCLELGIPTVSYHLDLFIGLHREPEITSNPFWRTQYVFTADGGHQAEFHAKGIQHFWLPPGVFARECVMEEPLEKYRCDVLFVGSRDYHKEHYRPQLIDWLKETYGARFVQYGHTEQTCIRGKPLNQLYASAKVVVGDSCNPGFSNTHYWSDRLPETLGRGGFLVHPYVIGIEQCYEVGKHFAPYSFGDFAGLKRTIDYYLTHDDERESIRKAGHAHVKTNQTYNQHLGQMLHILQGCQPSLPKE